jgi:hypothetical protein|tara:strand:- start:2535 stop:2705 length:171 start_codon:yes stop_codon:yes gene_type:complete
MKVTINKDTAFYVIPTKDLLRICINNDCFEKNMTIDGYFNLITSCLDAIQEMRRDE